MKIRTVSFTEVKKVLEEVNEGIEGLTLPTFIYHAIISVITMRPKHCFPRSRYGGYSIYCSTLQARSLSVGCIAIFQIDDRDQGRIGDSQV